VTDGPPITDVIGGVGGVAAEYAEIRSLADDFDQVGDRARSWAGRSVATLADLVLLASSPLAPVSFARVEAALVGAAAVGVVDAVLWEADAVGCRGAVLALEEADLVASDLMDRLDYTACRVLALPAFPLGFVLQATPDPLRDAVLDRLVDRLGPLPSGDPGAIDAWVIDHPGLVRHAINGSGGLLDSATLGPVPVVLHPTDESAAADAASWYDDPGHPAVSAGAVRLAAGPDSLAELMAQLSSINEQPAGTIAIATVPGGGHVVYLPGTDSLGLPWEFDPAIRDAQTDLTAAAGLPTGYAEGVRSALAAAGAGKPVLLVGHSLGGMVAAELASDPHLTVAGVVTAGSPVGATPESIPVLSLENRGDVVPLLSGEAPVDSIDHVTVQFDDHEASVVGNHELRHYVAGAAAVDASTDASVREAMAHLTPYLTGGEVVVREFTITRER